MNIRVNINILKRHLGDILREGDRDYDTFHMWAQNKDIKQGVVICDFIKVQEVPITEPITENKKNVKCEVCGLETTEHGLRIHMAKAHKE